LVLVRGDWRKESQSILIAHRSFGSGWRGLAKGSQFSPTTQILVMVKGDRWRDLSLAEPHKILVLVRGDWRKESQSILTIQEFRFWLEGIGERNLSCRTLPRARRRGDPSSVAGVDFGVFLLWKRESPPSIMVTRKPNWSFRDSKARDWLRKGKVLAPLVRPT
jgi:hypothetical protein